MSISQKGRRKALIAARRAAGRPDVLRTFRRFGISRAPSAWISSDDKLSHEAKDYGALQAAAVADSTKVDTVSGERIDVIHEGVADLRLGGTVARGDLLTTDANGQGVSATPAAGTNNEVLGKALTSGVNGDIISAYRAEHGPRSGERSRSSRSTGRRRGASVARGTTPTY